MTSSLSDLPYIAFLSTYPHPVFILHSKRQHGQAAPTLNPVFGNPAFRSLLLGPDADTAELGFSFLKALGNVEQAQEFSGWLDRARDDARFRQDTLVIALKPFWTALDASPVLLELTQTTIGDFVICTSTPRSVVPKYSTPAAAAPGVASPKSMGRDFKLRLPDFPLPPSQIRADASGTTPVAFSALMRTPTNSSQPNSRSPERPIEVPAQRTPGSMAEMIENYDWHLTPIGPRVSWPASLRTAVSYMLANPYPYAVWWGPELVLLYNDAYKEMSGSKHPQIFGERGSVSWGELWEFLGPVAQRVLAGEAVAKEDDLLFFHRLTEAKLPEETYHSWSWVPVHQEDGTVGGFINNTFETTSGVITARRMLFLRDLANKAGLARTQSDFACAVMDALNSFTIDCPFASFYFATVKETGPSTHDGGPRTSYIQKSVDSRPIKIELRRAGAVGVPDPHPSFPLIHELLLDPVTLRPSPSSRPQTGSPVPSLRPHDSPPSEQQQQQQPSGWDSSGRPSADNGTPSLTSSSASSVTAIQKSPLSNIIWPFDEAFGTRRSVHVQNIPDYVVEGLELRGWGEHAREAIIIPIVADDADFPTAVLILGLNSRRPYDKDYQTWTDLTRLSLNSLLTAVKGREADLKRAEHLAELDSAKTSFFSNASHELRTPLTLIQGPLQDAISQLTDSRAKENLKMAFRNVRRLSRLVDSLMDFSKIAANRLEGRFRAVQLGEYTCDLASLFRSVIEKSRIEYVVNCDPTDRKICYIDPDFWEKIVFNLIGNAFKYTMKGSIHVILEYDSDNVYFHVKDTGVGIPQSDIGKVFDRFHRVDAISRSHEGTGIGLALTKELVKLHGGTVTARSATEEESPENHGSCFTITLPLGKDHLPAAHLVQGNADIPQNRLYARGIVDEAIHWSGRQSEERTPSDSSDSGSGSGGSNDSSRMDPSTLFFVKNDIILLVDDNADMRRYIKSLLTPYCQVMESANGQEALHILEQVKPNLILSDVMMPVLDGYGLISRVRQRADIRLTPIVLVTAKESEESRVEGLLSGADDYLSKPFTGKELIARVHLQMQLGKRRIELEAKFLERTREIQLLSDLSPVGIIRVDEDGRVLYVNPRWHEISGCDSSADIDTWPESVREEDQQAVTDCWRTAFERKRGSSREFRFKNGIYAKASFQPLMDDGGALRGVIGTFTDVSDQRLYEASRLAHAQEREVLARKRAEEAEERRKEADERRRGQELLIDVTSHELRQPVSAILNCSSLVRSNLNLLREDLWRCYQNKEPFSPTEALLRGIDDDLDALDAIYQCGLAQERIANDVLSLSRIQLQVLSIHPVEFELETEVQRIVAIFRNELKMKRIDLDLSFGQSLKKLGISRVCSDKSRFGQVITNLLSNGIKFTDTSSNKRVISVAVEVSRWAPAPNGPCVPPNGPPGLYEHTPLEPDSTCRIFVYVAVRDSGPGLRPEDLALLFKRFQQGSNSHNVFGGSGLGLFVSRKLCDLMGGRIDVDSVYGEGATFRFFIEATTAPPTPHEANRHLDENSAAGCRSLDSPIGSSAELEVSFPLHVLITEDNLINQTVLNRQLKKAGCTTTLASNGLQALEKIQALAKSDQTKPNSQRRFDVILMDCEMPVMDGLTAVRELRKLEESGELPFRNLVYALTGNARAGQVQSARDAGMDDVIIKPYKLDELLTKIQEAALLASNRH